MSAEDTGFRRWWSVTVATLAAIGALAALADAARAETGVVIERATGSVQLVDNAKRTPLARVEGLGDLSHASLVFSQDARHVFVFGRDGGLTKVDIAAAKVVGPRRAGRQLHRRRDLARRADRRGGELRAGRREALRRRNPDAARRDPRDLRRRGQARQGRRPRRCSRQPLRVQPVRGRRDLGRGRDRPAAAEGDEARERRPRALRRADHPRRPLTTSPGCSARTGSRSSTWATSTPARSASSTNYGRGGEKLPVYKMPHLRGWAVAQGYAFLPAIGRHEVLVVDARDLDARSHASPCTASRCS